MLDTMTNVDVNALLEVGVLPDRPTHNILLIKESGTEEVKSGLGIADAMRVAYLQSKDLGGYAQVRYKDTVVALYYKGELMSMSYEAQEVDKEG